MITFLILFVTINLVLIIEDFRDKKVHLSALIALGLCNSYYLFLIQWNDQWYLSLAFISVILLLLAGYIKIRFKGKLKLLKAFGLGDILFLLAMVPLYNLHQYMIFFNVAVIIALLYAVFFLRQKFERIPLISFFGIVNVILVGLSSLNLISFFNIP